MNDRYEIVIYWSQEDGCFLAEVPEIPTPQPLGRLAFA
jgi:predicted RNase H-like HicB family nuclease